MCHDVQKVCNMEKREEADYLRKKEEIVLFRLDAEQKKKLKNEARKNNLSMSEYMRRILAEPPSVTAEEFKHVQLKLLYEIRKIGVNINQIAKKYNEYFYTEPRKDLLDKMDRIEGLTKEVVSILTRRG